MRQNTEINIEKDNKNNNNINTNFRNKSNFSNDNNAHIKQYTNDNLSLIDIRNREFYEMKENNFQENNNTNNNINFDKKNLRLMEYVNYAPKLYLVVKNKIII